MKKQTILEKAKEASKIFNIEFDKYNEKPIRLDKEYAEKRGSYFWDVTLSSGEVVGIGDESIYYINGRYYEV